MPIQAVVREVDLAAHKPFCPRTIPFQNFVPLLEPVHLACNARPEFIRVVDRLIVNMLVFLEALNVRLLTEFRRTLKLPLLVQDGINVGALGIDNGFIGHDKNLDAEELFLPAQKLGTRSQEFILHSTTHDAIEITR
jgi:hypothetical protein